MKIAVDKEYTSIANYDKVKADIVDFKAAYTEGDLLRMFCEKFEEFGGSAFDVLRCDGEAFCGSPYSDTTFCFIMWVMNWSNVHRFQFYITNGEVADTCNTRTFKAV